MTDTGYITRLHILKTPWFALCLHWLNTPDPEPYLHDHPVSFLSVILRGGYTEDREKFTHNRRRFTKVNRWFNWIRASSRDRHTIIEVKPKTLTLCLMGPKTREWGYHLPDGWMYWKDYVDIKREGIQP